jgi:hypothetical protein
MTVVGEIGEGGWLLVCRVGLRWQRTGCADWRIDVGVSARTHQPAARRVIGKSEDCRKAAGKEEAGNHGGRQPHDCPASRASALGPATNASGRFAQRCEIRARFVARLQVHPNCLVSADPKICLPRQIAAPIVEVVPRCKVKEDVGFFANVRS